MEQELVNGELENVEPEEDDLDDSVGLDFDEYYEDEEEEEPNYVK